MWNDKIGRDDKPKLASIGDYWYEQMTKEMFYLLREYEDLFLSLVAELKWIKGDIGEIKIILKHDANPVRHRPYQLSPRVKENVN